MATGVHLRQEHPGAACWVLDAVATSPATSSTVDLVDPTRGTPTSSWSVGPGRPSRYELLDRAFRQAASTGVPFVAMHRNLTWKVERRPAPCDSGAFVLGLGGGEPA